MSLALCGRAQLMSKDAERSVFTESIKGQGLFCVCVCLIVTINSLTSSCFNWLCPVGFSNTASLSSIILILLQHFTTCCVNMLLNTVYLIFFFFVPFGWVLINSTFLCLSNGCSYLGKKTVCVSSSINTCKFFFLIYHASFWGRWNTLNLPWWINTD